MTIWEWRARQRPKQVLWGQLVAELLLARTYKKTGF